MKITKSWYELLKPEFESENFKNLEKFLSEEYSKFKIFPPEDSIFNALNLTPFEKVKVVIVGQDPYHEEGQANGLCFSVSKETALPPSLINIYKEIESDLGIKMANHGDLSSWAKQGVLLLNAVLTVRKGNANSHKGKGWEVVTSAIIQKLNKQERPIVFMLWGRNAQEFASNIDKSKHLVLACAHPSPLSAFAGFFGCKHFSKANAFLKEHGESEIDWQIK